MTGWQWTQQQYDWQGRPTRTTNQDGTIRGFYYAGCGCAGGEVVTAIDEAGRSRRIQKDVAGRLSRVEELNWDQSVYATTNYLYNARDQIVRVTQQGDRVRTFSYDGHGRLQTRNTPEQGLTTYGYYADDTVRTVTDARGASQTFGYNGRHLVTGITYGVPAGVEPTANVAFDYDAAGNMVGDGVQGFSYDAAGSQVRASYHGLWQGHDGDGLRVKKIENGAATTYYLRSTVLGGQPVAEFGASGQRQRGYAYLGSQVLAVQQWGQAYLVHQDPVTKSQRLTDTGGMVASVVELDPWGAETSRSWNADLQPRRMRAWERDRTGDESLCRRYHGWWSRFAHPDPYDGSYDLTDPQSFNRYSYARNDPVNFTDPTGLTRYCVNVDGGDYTCEEDDITRDIGDGRGGLPGGGDGRGGGGGGGGGRGVGGGGQQGGIQQKPAELAFQSTFRRKRLAPSFRFVARLLARPAYYLDVSSYKLDEPHDQQTVLDNLPHFY